MRNEAALQGFFDDILAAYPLRMQRFAEQAGITERQMRMSVRIWIRREHHGDQEATMLLDNLERLLCERERRGDDMPMRENPCPTYPR